MKRREAGGNEGADQVFPMERGCPSSVRGPVSPCCLSLALVVVLVGVMTAQLRLSDASEGAMKTTFKIEGPTAGGFAVGSFFLAGAKVSSPSRDSATVCLLVTAKHVLSDIVGDTASVTLRRLLPDGTYEKVRCELLIRRNSKPLWSVLPDTNIDVAVMLFDLPSFLDYRFVTEDLMDTDSSFDFYALAPGDRLMCLGYPLNRDANAAGFPIARGGTIASYPLFPASRYRSFQLDFEVYPGNSGGPAFFIETGRFSKGMGNWVNNTTFFLAGIVTGRWTDKVDGVGGMDIKLAEIVPAQLIKEAIDHLMHDKGLR